MGVAACMFDFTSAHHSFVYESLKIIELCRCLQSVENAAQGSFYLFCNRGGRDRRSLSDLLFGSSLPETNQTAGEAVIVIVKWIQAVCFSKKSLIKIHVFPRYERSTCGAILFSSRLLNPVPPSKYCSIPKWIEKGKLPNKLHLRESGHFGGESLNDNRIII